MPRHADPEAEARRIAAVRVALAVFRPWLASTGARTARGKRAASQNRLKHGADSRAFILAIRYCGAIESSLENKA